MTIKEFIKIFTLERCSVRSTPERHFYTGFTMRDGEVMALMIQNHLLFHEMEPWCQYPYRIVWAKKFTPGGAILTYCEGDLHLEVYETNKCYEKYIKSIHRFYVGESNG